MTSSGAPNLNGSKSQLSPYEQQRTTQKVITDAMEEVAVHADSVRNEFTCAICLGLLQNTVATTECGHRFCENCIAAVLRRCNKVCPVCHTEITSKQSLRRDHCMDNMIAVLFRNQEEYCAAHLRHPAESTECHLAQATEEQGAEELPNVQHENR
ncbi:hypothetical protein HPB49_001715 [Dermacentor silvarum]|uniref:Uncharacterized protein n=1 Tax=Dermacentor silvarum TaxID=543639 RepID=A0ACB8DMQ3_DERSI|nr:E3 ubiquitin-protein ligase RING2 [Dermacentor silvarum]KAH7973494.1 hypothetical protein HPB49_001715 [Dermacentor silvarum]